MTEYAALTTTTATGENVTTTIREAGPSPFMVESKINGEYYRTETGATIGYAQLRQREMHNDAVRAFGGYPKLKRDGATTQPAAVDMGGDIEALVEAVNAEPAPIADYVNVDKGVNSGVTVSPTDGRYYAFVSVNGSVVDNELFDDKYLAMAWAKTWFDFHTTGDAVAWAQPDPGMNEIEAIDFEDMQADEPLSLWGELTADRIGWSSGIERTPTYQGGAVAWWNTRDPWATAKEAKRRKDEIRAKYRG